LSDQGFVEEIEEEEERIEEEFVPSEEGEETIDFEQNRFDKEKRDDKGKEKDTPVPKKRKEQKGVNLNRDKPSLTIVPAPRTTIPQIEKPSSPILFDPEEPKSDTQTSSEGI